MKTVRYRQPSSPDPRRAGAAGVAGILLGLLFAGVVGVFLWLRVDRGGTTAVDPDRVVAVESRDVIDCVNSTGRVEPLARVAVMSRASGIIEALMADEGDVVKEGEVLAQLDREQLQAQHDQDMADSQAAEARLAAARARVDEARARLEDPEPDFLERESQRFSEQFEQGDVSVKEKEDADRALANARFRVQMVRANLPVLEAAVSEAEADVAAAKAALERSATALREATIHSPIDGVVLVRDKEVGDGVSSILTAGGNATQIMTLGDLSEMYVEARVDEVDLGRIQVGMPALVSVDAYRDRQLDGKVRRIAPAGSVDTNGIVTFEVEVTVQDPDHILRPDMTADAKLVIARKDGVPSLPQIALRPGEGGKWLVDRVVGEGDDAHVEPTTVRLGLSDGLMTEIVEGLAPGDHVLMPIAQR